MKYIDIEKWKRRKHFEFFNSMDYPHFSLCADVDVTAVRKYTKENDISFFKAVLYMTSQAANGVPQLRQRIRGKKVVEHKVVHPSFTMLTEDELFSFCLVEYSPGFAGFAGRTEKAMEEAAENPRLADPEGRDDLPGFLLRT